MAVKPELRDSAATFLAEDPAVLVAASFVCPLCLHGASWVYLVERDGFGSASCRCMRCDVMWVVLLTPAQLLRMALAPPPGLMVLNSAAFARRSALPADEA